MQIVKSRTQYKSQVTLRTVLSWTTVRLPRLLTVKK